MPPKPAQQAEPQKLVQLSPKDQKTFQDLLTHYEARDLVKARKEADQILKRTPEHAETMCMKGLIMVHHGERKEGMDLIREGMRRNVQSHVVWHVWGMALKGDHQFEEALKSYLQALRRDPNNYGIMRETSALQTHARQYDALLETRVNLLRLRPYWRANWLGVAFAYRINGNLIEAKRWMEHFEAFLRNVPARDPEYGELIFFYIRLLEDLGELQEALSVLDNKTKERYLVDRLSIVEWRTRLLGKLKSRAESNSTQIEEWTQTAEHSWRELIDSNPDSHDFYKGFLANAGIDLANLTDESRTKALEILEEFSSKHSKANAPKRLALTIAQGEKFKELAKPYLERALQKGVPSLFSDLKNLYADSSKLQSIQDIVEDIRLTVTPKESSQPKSPEPTDYLWCLYFLAQHYSYLGQHQTSLDILDTAIEHTPTLPELYMIKARVLKRAGDPFGAVRAMDESRKLDGQDRFVNTKAGIYRLRVGMIDEADEVFGLFTRKGMRPSADLLEMQALHYFRELGDAQRRHGKYNLALKAYYNIQDVFTTFRMEQIDFHLYSIRKAMLSSYLDMLTWEDNLHLHPAYIHAAVWAARIWIKLYDDPSIIKSLQPPELTGEVSKKDLNKARKAKHKAAAGSSQHDDSNAKARVKQYEDKGLEGPPPKDQDPKGIQLVAATDPLERANKFLTTVEAVEKENVDVAVTTFDVAIRRKKYLKAARSLRRAHAHDSQHPEVHIRIVRLAQAVASIDDSVSETVKSILKETLSIMKPSEVSLETFNGQYLQLNSASPLAALACAKVSQLLDAPREEIETLLFATLNEDVKLRIPDALEILAYLQEIQSPRADEFRKLCDEKFVLSKVFKDPSEQATLRRECVNALDEGKDETVE